jgi:MFS family permease
MVPTSADNPAPSIWRPLRTPAFRNLLIADIISDVGTFMQTVGAAWLMVSLSAGPMYVALTQTASALPFFVFALPAGAIGDIVDRRKLILFTETWMLLVALLLAGLTLAGLMSPVMLLILTFALSAGDAFESPTWRAVLPELVPKKDLTAAAALNGIEFNFARAIGPALAGVLIAAAGVGTAFLVNAASFFGVIVVIARWKRNVRKRTTPAETLTGAMVAGLRYVRYSPEIRAIIFRSGCVMFFASALLALLPSVAHSVKDSPVVYGLLLGCFGLGAVLGALLLQPARARLSTEVVVSGGIVIFSLTTAAAGSLHALPALSLAMLMGGAAWIVFISLFNVLILNLTPDWVRARVLAVSMLVFQGAVAAGSAAWGALAGRVGIHNALLWGGVGTMATAVLGLFLKLPNLNTDVTPWIPWPMPRIVNGGAAADIDVEDAGPILVTIEYEVIAEKTSEFLDAVHRFARIRRRDGASSWGVFRDLEAENRYLETFKVDSWAEHLRQHERLTQADREIEERVLSYTRSQPTVRHLVSAK